MTVCSASRTPCGSPTPPGRRSRHCAATRTRLRAWGTSDAGRAEVVRGLGGEGPARRVRGLARYLEWAWSGREPDDWSAFAPPDPAARCPFWDWDQAVLAAKLTRMGRSGRAAA